jgi:hypothetical protein
VEFKDLYHRVEAEFADGERTTPVGFEFLRKAIEQSENDVQEVKVWRLVYNPAKREAHFMLFDDRTSAYEGEYLVADISYCASLDTDPAELLFALCKELMHVFDPPESRINTREKFIKFLKDLQNTPLDQDNMPLGTEHRAKWMALLVLCPKPLRESIIGEISAGHLRSEVAERLGLPDWLIEVATDEYYDTALAILTE